MRPLSLLAALAGCTGHDALHGGGHGAHAGLPPARPLLRGLPESELGQPASARDEDPRPDVVAVTISARVAQHAYLPGLPATVWAYDGQIPGPTIEARRGDTVVVRFKNELPEPTTVHWHGLRVPNEMDGAGRALAPVPPGGTFEYHFVVPDAGTFWYHPHVRSDVQVEKGLYGAIVVRDPDEPDVAATLERLLVLDDVGVDPASGQLDDGDPQGAHLRAEMMGREGNLLLVNGRPAGAALPVRPGERLRLRVVNAANARHFALGASGARLTQIGSDGGLLTAPRAVGPLRLVPGERVDVLVDVDVEATLAALPVERARGAGASEGGPLLRLAPAGASVSPAAPIPARLREIETLAPAGAGESVELDETMQHGGWRFLVNRRAFPDVPRFEASLGSRPLWTVTNRSDMDHPLHLHGFFFQKRGVPEWKDTIDVPAGSTVELVVDLAARPGALGDWMYHCHILEHAERGMMGEVRVR